MTRQLFRSALPWVLLFAPIIAHAEGNRTMDKMVVTATMTEKRIIDAPGSVEVITSQDMADLNAQNVAQALESAVGLMVSNESGRVKVPSIRGARAKQTLVLLDGRRLAYGFNEMIDLRQIPTTMVERIEIVRGPASALYGSDALGGVVNIITKKASRDWTAKVSGQYGSQFKGENDRFDVGGYIGGGTDQIRSLIAMEAGRENGWDKDGEAPDDGFGQEPSFLAGRLAWDLTENQSLTAGAEYMQNTYDGAQFYEAMTRTRTADENRKGYFLQYDADFLDVHTLMLRLNRSEYDNDLKFTPHAASGKRDTEQYTNQFEGRYSGLFLDKHLVTIGGEARSDGLDDTQAGLNTDKHADNYSLFLQDEFQVLDPLTLTVSLRYDNHSAFGDHWSPRASVVYAVLEGLRFKGSFGQGFRAPSLSELYVTSLRQKGKLIFEANKDLKEEDSTSYELGVEGEYGDVYGGLTLFRNEVDNMIESVFDRSEGQGKDKKDYYMYKNIAKATLQGVEVQAGAKLPFGFSLDGSAMWLDADNKTGGEDIGGQPKLKAFGKLGYALPEFRFRANIHATFVDRMTYSGGDEKSYTVCGAYMAKGLSENFEIFAGADNVFGTQVKHLDVEQIEPATFYAGLTMKF
ncbi:MAG: TonB-dependent receptor [Deltaproteobacteria bacterium]|nr:TonB-dependent receptor [Deltaproteobacteria bacterium]